MISAKRALAEMANPDLEIRFKCLDEIGLDPWRIGTIARACLALLMAHHPAAPERSLRAYEPLPGKAHCA